MIGVTFYCRVLYTRNNPAGMKLRFFFNQTPELGRFRTEIANMLKTIKSHQVAGRNPMFELSSFHILKPLNQREAQFYQKFPRNLKDRSSESS